MKARETKCRRKGCERVTSVAVYTGRTVSGPLGSMPIFEGQRTADSGGWYYDLCWEHTPADKRQAVQA